MENPIKIFAKWFEEAKKEPKVADHTEFCLATSSKAGKPSARILLLKGFDEKGFIFFTNYNGRKGVELIKNPNAAICFYWNALGKQIRIEGKVKKISANESNKYFSTRPRGSQISAITSKQSSELASRDKFLKELELNNKKFSKGEILRPDFWGGFILIPERIEFWKAHKFRAHEREVFERSKGKWEKKLLYP